MCARQGDEWSQDLVGQLPACFQLLIGEGYQVGATSCKVVGRAIAVPPQLVGWVVGQKRAG